MARPVNNLIKSILSTADGISAPDSLRPQVARRGAIYFYVVSSLEDCVFESHGVKNYLQLQAVPTRKL